MRNWLEAPVLLGVNHSLSRRLSSCFTKVEINATRSHHVCLATRLGAAGTIGTYGSLGGENRGGAGGCWETLHSHFSDCGLGAPAVHCGGGGMCCNNYTHIGVHFLCSLLTTRHMEVHDS